MLLAIRIASKWIFQEKIQIVHARSLIPAVIGLILKTIFKVKLVFDIRGFALDEKILEGRLKRHSPLTYLLKKLEALLYRQADHIVTLTHVSKPLIQKRYRVNLNKITVIPTCANAALFKPATPAAKLALRKKLGYKACDIILLHNGSINAWVDFDGELKLFKAIAMLMPNVKFLFLNRGEHKQIQRALQAHQLDQQLCKILSVDLASVADYLNIADLSVFFIKPSPAKEASAPTKFAEIIACHLLSVTNTQYGDMTFYLSHYPVGCLVTLEQVHQNPIQSANKVIAFMAAAKNTEPMIKNHFKHLFADHFSKTLAIKRYLSVYQQVLNVNLDKH